MDGTRVTDVDRVRLVTWSRPGVLNTFDAAQYRETAAALTSAASDDAIAAVVLTGDGRAFSSGQDLAEMSRLASGETPGGDNGFAPLLRVLVDFPKPLLAAVNGVGVGLGFTILAHCDLVLVAASARLKLPFASLGVAPEAASSYLFPARIGWQRAAFLLFSGDWVTAAELVEYGLALRVCADEVVVDETMRLAARIAAAPLPSLMATKRLLLAGQRDAVLAARQREDAEFASLLRGDATADALASFLGGGSDG